MSEDKSIEQIEYEKRLRRRLKILQEQLEAGKIRFAKDLQIEKSLMDVRIGSDGEIDLDTVDGAVRSMALAITVIHDREELKKEVSLSEIQNMYFNFINDNFGGFYKIMRERGLTPHQAGLAARNSDDSIKELTQNLDEFLGLIEQFWKDFGEIAHIHVEDMHGNVKGVFGSTRNRTNQPPHTLALFVVVASRTGSVTRRMLFVNRASS